MGSKFRQIGNAVPPLLARQIGEVVAKLLDD
jgi:site-specific DNA-cytosine methylase